MKIGFRSIIKKILSYFNFSIVTKVNGHNFKLPILGGLGLTNGKIKDQWMLEVLKLIIPISGSKFIDVGANVGQTLIKVKSIKNNVFYIGFEPNPSCLHYLSRLIKINNLSETVVVPVAIGTNTSIGRLHFYSENEVETSASTIINFRRQGIVNQRQVPLFKVSDLGKDIDLNSISILKIDVEGSELLVIEEFEDIIKRDHPFILIEILPVYDKSQNPKRLSNQKKIEKILTEMNYSMFRIKKSNDRLKEFKQIKTIEIHSNLNDCDYLMVPPTRLKTFNTISQKTLKS